MELERKVEEELSLFKYYLCRFDKTGTRFLKNLDRQILKNFREAEIETRAVQSNGLWCCFLIPTVLFLYSSLYPVPPLYKQTAYLSVGLLCYSLLFIIFTSVSCLVLKKHVFGGCVASALLSALLLYCFLGQDLLVALTLSLISVFIYNLSLRLCLVSFPKTFTIGELMIVLQGAVLSYIMAVSKLVHKRDTDEDTILINTVVYTVLSTVGLIVTALAYLSKERRTLESLSYIVAAAVVIVLVTLHVLLGSHCIPQILGYIFLDNSRLRLFTLWLTLVLSAVVILVVRTKMGLKANTTTRKSFHVLAALVFMSGILSDLQFMRLSAGLIFGLLVLVEAMRKSGIEPISSALQSAFDIYKDEKDSGSFALTPIYMYVGLACPLLLVPEHSGASLELLSGALATGIGDSTASWLGQRLGNNKWPDGNRTYEGTAFNILSQITAVYALQLFELLDAKNALLRTAAAATAASLVEARTEQVDNLVLPLVMLIAYQGTCFLA